MMSLSARRRVALCGRWGSRLTPLPRQRSIADVKMPGINGIELQSLVHAPGRRTPIIFITAVPEERIRVRAMQAGAIGFLSKPFDVETLIKYLDLALRSNDGAAQN
jgi:FixJ family two-component response regulator